MFFHGGGAIHVPPGAAGLLVALIVLILIAIVVKYVLEQ